MSKSKSTGLRAALNAKCRGCIYDPNAAGTAAQQILACTDSLCELWQVRPVNSPSNGRILGTPIRDDLGLPDELAEAIIADPHNPAVWDGWRNACDGSVVQDHPGRILRYRRLREGERDPYITRMTAPLEDPWAGTGQALD